MSVPTPPPAAPARFTLRQLPLPAKLVVTLFMLTVGLGYSSAMVQMHFQHTQGDGQPMPGVGNVVEIFAGKKWVTREEAEKSRPLSKLEKLVMGPVDGVFSGGVSMAPAFFHKDPCKDKSNNYKDLTGVSRGHPDPAVKAKLDPEREGERQAVKLWILTPDAERRAAYDQYSFTPPAGQAPAAITTRYVTGTTINVRAILTDRCVACHSDEGSASGYPLDSYEELVKYMEAPPGVVIPEGAPGAWCGSDRQISKEKLAQSTHAHLLSFAMLFSLTGLVFAFTSYPGLFRGILGPLVLVAQVADVSCWWLARVEGPGPYFAMAIIGTGGLVGLGLGAQIVLSVFNAYGMKGKAVLAAMFLGAGGGSVLLYTSAIHPQLQAEKERKRLLDEGSKSDTKTQAANAATAGINAIKGPDKKADEQSPMEKQLLGKWEDGLWPMKDMPVPPGAMVRAFFDKETEFKDAFKARNDGPAELKAYQALLAEREGEVAIVRAWVKAPADARKAAYDSDKFPLPTEMKDKPLTASYTADTTKAVKIKTLLEDRCMGCHDASTKVPLDTYEALDKYFKPAGK